VELAPHAGVLRALAGEEEDDVAPLLGELAALDVGVRSGGRWRVNRRDLDAIAGEALANKNRNLG